MAKVALLMLQYVRDVVRGSEGELALEGTRPMQGKQQISREA